MDIFCYFFILNIVLPDIIFLHFLGYFNYRIPLWFLIVSIILASVLYKIYKELMNRGPLVIIKAIYGIGSSIYNITDKLQEYIIDNKLWNFRFEVQFFLKLH